MDKTYSSLAFVLKALGDETRLKIFQMLSNGELCACNILEEFNITQPTLSYHMKILSDSELVRSRRDGVWVKYTLNPEVLIILQEFFDSVEKSLKESKPNCTKRC